MKTPTQEEQVIQIIRQNGGYATLRYLNQSVDTSTWKTKTPEATIRRIVQLSPHIFRLQPGLWALEDMRTDVLKRFRLQIGNPKSEDIFSHGYYQGLLAEVGRFMDMETYIPAQDQNRMFLGQSLKHIANTTSIPPLPTKIYYEKPKQSMSSGSTKNDGCLLHSTKLNTQQT